MSHIHIDVEHLNFAYEKNMPILKDISFSAKEHDAIGIVGANGAGKSTLLKLLVGLDLRFEGDIRVEEIPLSVATLGKIREKTHLPINLPLNIQLNYAARGGTRLTTTGETYWYSVNGESTTSARRPLLGRAKDNVESTSPQRDCDANSGTAYVGSYLPNDFGLYDTLGNVYEYTSELAYSGGSFPCREYYWELYGDTTIGNTKSNPIIDPPGIAYGHSLATRADALKKKSQR